MDRIRTVIAKSAIQLQILKNIFDLNRNNIQVSIQRCEKDVYSLFKALKSMQSHQLHVRATCLKL